MFIVLEGLDGAGKSTQIRKLRELFAARGIESEYVHFPRFDAPVYGELIARYLRGELGSVEQVDPYIVALLFAGDRADMAAQIRRWEAEGKVVIVDRYVYSNIGYQCAKMPTEEGREQLKEWILRTEYDHFAIPRPDVSLFLDVPFAFTAKSLTTQRTGDDRNYLNGGTDIHEASLDLQQMVRRVYLEAARSDTTLKVIDCNNAEGGMDTPEGIFAKIEQSIAPLLKTL
ncbi:MAG: dTMP kinase [Alistipes sp.]|nr:dTMP kinase [Alistipes sp.]